MSEIRVEKKAAVVAVVKRLVKSTLVTFVIAVVLYCLCAVFLGRYLVTNNGVIFVSSPSFEGGYVPAGETVIAGTDSKHGDALERNFVDAFTYHTDLAEVRVVAGPYGEVDAPIDEFEGRSLNSEYLVECVSGNCIPGEHLALPADAIAGVQKDMVFLPESEMSES